MFVMVDSFEKDGLEASSAIGIDFTLWDIAFFKIWLCLFVHGYNDFIFPNLLNI